MQISVQIVRVVTGGPVAYTIFKDGFGDRIVTGVPNVNAALNAVRDEVAALVGTETVNRITMNVSSS